MSRHGKKPRKAPKEKVESPPAPSEQEQVPQEEVGLAPPEGPSPTGNDIVTSTKKKKRKKRK